MATLDGKPDHLPGIGKLFLKKARKIGSILGFVSHEVFVATTLLCLCIGKGAYVMFEVGKALSIGLSLSSPVLYWAP